MAAVHTPGGGAIVLTLRDERHTRPSRRGGARRTGARPTGPLSDCLGRGTAPLHEHVDGRRDLPDGLADRAHYRALLVAMLGAWDAVERTLATSGLGPRTARHWADVQGRIDAWGRGCAGAEVDRAVWAAQLTFAIVGGAMAGALARPPAAGGIAARRPTARRAVKVPV